MVTNSITLAQANLLFAESQLELAANPQQVSYWSNAIAAIQAQIAFMARTSAL